MFFSVEYGIGKEVEPRFYNAECATGTLLRAIRDDAVAAIGSQIDAKISEYKRETIRLEQEILDQSAVASPKGAKGAKADPKVEEWKNELQRMKTNLPKIEELRPLIGKITKVDLSFTDSPAGRLNLDFDSYALANTFFQPKCRTWLVGLVADSTEGVILKWDL